MGNKKNRRGGGKRKVPPKRRVQKAPETSEKKTADSVEAMVEEQQISPPWAPTPTSLRGMEGVFLGE